MSFAGCLNVKQSLHCRHSQAGAWEREKKKFPYSHPHCVALKRKVDNINQDLDERWDELDRNPQDLPERKGPGEVLSETRRGHRTIINDYSINRDYWQKRYDDECGDDESECESCSATAATIVGGYIVYRCARLLPSLFPPLWWTLPANVLVPY